MYHAMHTQNDARLKNGRRWCARSAEAEAEAGPQLAMLFLVILLLVVLFLVTFVVVHLCVCKARAVDCLPQFCGG